jgi:predicted GNAT family acetyltransferase
MVQERKELAHMTPIIYKTDLQGVDWNGMKAALVQDDFDNGRTPAQLEASFTQSAHACLAYADGRLIGTARSLSDGVCNGYIVDVWTLSTYRRQGVASVMVRRLLDRMPGQPVYLFSDDAADLYQKIGFVERPVGLEIVVGRWLDNTPLARGGE